MANGRKDLSGGLTVGERWAFGTKWGEFAIEQRGDRFVALFDGESLGAYASPFQALEDLVGGHTVSPSNGLDTSKAELPEELSGWTRTG
jgi:hypothetical protein